MAFIDLPFPNQRVTQDGCDHGAPCTLRPMLPKALQEVCANNPFVNEYLHRLPIDDVGIPDYYPKLSRSLKDRTL